VKETLAEERRLCYVGMTRAREQLIFSVTRMRRLWGDVAFRPPSRFLREAGLTVVPGTPRGADSGPRPVSPRPSARGARPIGS
jgi:DNA helicase-2/ATP-dependent DNA helicase PcrA